MGLNSLRGLERAAYQRNHTADLYRGELGRLPGIAFQEIDKGNRSSYREYSIMLDGDSFGLDRDELAIALLAENIDVRKYYDPPVHRQTAYTQFAPKSETLHNTDLLAARSLSLPMWSEMSDETALNICRAVARIHEFASEIAAALRQPTTASAI
jgi:dTDP-4-amino-4,6-dideoxygalactose transaminase